MKLANWYSMRAMGGYLHLWMSCRSKLLAGWLHFVVDTSWYWRWDMRTCSILPDSPSKRPRASRCCSEWGSPGIKHSWFYRSPAFYYAFAFIFTFLALVGHIYMYIQTFVATADDAKLDKSDGYAVPLWASFGSNNYSYIYVAHWNSSISRFRFRCQPRRQVYNYRSSHGRLGWWSERGFPQLSAGMCNPALIIVVLTTFEWYLMNNSELDPNQARFLNLQHAIFLNPMHTRGGGGNYIYGGSDLAYWLFRRPDRLSCRPVLSSSYLAKDTKANNVSIWP